MGSGPMQRGPSAGSNAGGSVGGVGGSAGGPRALASSDTIIVRNLPENCTWQGLREGFSHCGEIKYAEMKERGTGLVRFINERDAERAICLLLVRAPTLDLRLDLLCVLTSLVAATGEDLSQ